MSDHPTIARLARICAERDTAEDSGERRWGYWGMMFVAWVAETVELHTSHGRLVPLTDGPVPVGIHCARCGDVEGPVPPGPVSESVAPAHEKHVARGDNGAPSTTTCDEVPAPERRT